MPALAESASVRSVMHVSATTIPSVLTTKLVFMDEDDDKAVHSDEVLTGEHRLLIQAMLEKLELPEAAVFSLSFEGAFADVVHLRVKNHHVQLLRGSGIIPDHAVITLLLRY